MCLCGPRVLDQLAGFNYGMPVRYICFYALWWAIYCFVVFPWGGALLYLVVSRCMWLKGKREVLWLCFGCVVFHAWLFGNIVLLDVWKKWAELSQFGLAT